MNKSDCCNAEVRVEGNTTKYHVCLKCNKPCDIGKPKTTAMGVPILEKMDLTTFQKPKTTKYYQVTLVCEDKRIEVTRIAQADNPEQAYKETESKVVKAYGYDWSLTDIKLIETIQEDTTNQD
jgi:hypothetical protein